MSELTLALHSGHNASVVIGDSKGPQFAIQEERLRGEKNYWGFPERAIDASLKAVGAKASDVRWVCVGGVGMYFVHYHSRDDILAAYKRQDSLVGKIRQRVAMPLVSAFAPNYGLGHFTQSLARSGLGHAGFQRYDHHTCHAASAYYGLRKSSDEKALVVTCDGDGDGNCASVRIFDGGRIQEIAATSWDNSLGAIYSWITFAMGFMPLEHEYKLMGMAPYASDSAAAETAKVFHKYLGLDASGLRLKRTTVRRISDMMETLMAEFKGVRFDYICAGLQRFTEDLLCEWIRRVVQHTGIRRVYAAGGVFMNVKANKRIAELSEIEYFEAFPSCGDETLPFGAFWMKQAEQFGAEKVEPLRHFYWGDSCDDAQSEATLKASQLPFEKPNNIADAVASLLAKGEPVARCAGNMEFGARALGNRSILGDPSNSDLVRVINQMVKKRDFWMPFAPMVKAERSDEYLKNPKQLRSPFMMMTFDTKHNFREFIAAVHNADLTCRAQILERTANPDMYAIIEAFEKRTGRAIILNTSFNLHGFPIVRTAQEALHVFQNSGLNYLQVGSYIVRKPNRDPVQAA